MPKTSSTNTSSCPPTDYMPSTPAQELAESISEFDGKQGVSTLESYIADAFVRDLGITTNGTSSLTSLSRLLMTDNFRSQGDDLLKNLQGQLTTKALQAALEKNHPQRYVFTYRESTEAIVISQTTALSLQPEEVSVISSDDLIDLFGLQDCPAIEAKQRLSRLTYSGTDLQVDAQTVSIERFLSRASSDKQHDSTISPPNSTWIGRKLPTGLSAMNLTDQISASLDRIIGQSSVPILISFWGTWCGPCLTERQEYQQVDAKADNFQHVYVADAQSSKPALRRYLKTNSISGTQELWDSDQTLTQTLQIQSYPTNILVSPNGTILDVKEGVYSLKELQEHLK